MRSDAEQLVEAELKRCLPADWIRLPSLWLKNHPAKVHAEVDFLVIGDRAVLLLEVKGGYVSRDHDGWHFETKSGSNKGTKREGPFDQVREAYYALREHLRDLGRIDLFHNYVWGYGVILPECILAIPRGDAGIDSEIVLDLRGFPAGFCEFLDRLTDLWRARCLEVKRNNRISENSLCATIPPRVREEMESHLRPVLQPVRGLALTAREVEAQIRRLTLEQYRALDQAALNEQIILVGAAGTGKTVLAMEQSLRQAAEDNRRVLLTCFNRFLANHLRQRFENQPESPRIDVANYHQLVWKLLQDAEMTSQIPEDWDEFNQQLEDLVLTAVDRLMAKKCFRPYDYLVIDEGQDLMHPSFFGALSLLLDGGIEKGRWTICIDPTQTIFEHQFEKDLYESICNRGAKTQLTVNCRNTRQVAAYVAGLAEAGAMPTEGTDGPDPEIFYYQDAPSYRKLLKKAVNSLLGDLEKGKLPPGDVVVLAARKDMLPEEIRQQGFFVWPVIAADAPLAAKGVRLATVQSFKGLEASAIVLTGFPDLDSRSVRRLLYVGGSRARVVLRLLLPDCCNAYVETNLHKILAALNPTAGPKRSPLF